jgi:hypothetical protein
MEWNSPSETEARVADHNISHHINNPETCYSFHESLSPQRQFNPDTFLYTLVLQDPFEYYPRITSMSLKCCVPLSFSN